MGSGSHYNFGGMTSSAGGYGGYGAKKEEHGALDTIKQSVGGIVSGAGTYITSGISYLKGKE